MPETEFDKHLQILKSEFEFSGFEGQTVRISRIYEIGNRIAFEFRFRISHKVDQFDTFRILTNLETLGTSFEGINSSSILVIDSQSGRNILLSEVRESELTNFKYESIYFAYRSY